MADDLSVVNGARVSFARRKEELDDADAGPDPLPHARPARHAVRAQRLPLPHPLPDLRRARVVPAPDRLVQRVLDAVREGDRRLLRARRRGRALARSASRAPTRSSRSTRSSPSSTREELRAVYDAAYATYTRLVEQGVARELARSVLPVGAYTEFYWTVNARALMNFVSLRAADTAQREIRRYAEACERFLAEQMPITYDGVRGERPHRAVGCRRHRHRRRLPPRPGPGRCAPGTPRTSGSRSRSGAATSSSHAAGDTTVWSVFAAIPTTSAAATSR